MEGSALIRLGKLTCRVLSLDITQGDGGTQEEIDQGADQEGCRGLQGEATADEAGCRAPAGGVEAIFNRVGSAQVETMHGFDSDTRSDTRLGLPESLPWRPLYEEGLYDYGVC